MARCRRPGVDVEVRGGGDMSPVTGHMSAARVAFWRNEFWWSTTVAAVEGAPVVG